MSCLTPSQRRWLKVPVASIPVERRLQAARVACRHENDSIERQRILMLALEPGDLVAYVAP